MRHVIDDTVEPKRNRSERGCGSRPDPTDVDLVKRYRSGATAAVLELFDRHGEPVGLYCYRMIGDRERAKDVSQDVWIRFLATADAEEIRNPLGLLYTIARRLSLNAIRDRKNHLSIEDLSVDEHPRIEQPERTRLEEMAILALDRLPVDQKEALILHGYSGFSFREIAEMTGESSGTIRMRAMRGRKAIKRFVAALIEFEENRREED